VIPFQSISDHKIVPIDLPELSGLAQDVYTPEPGKRWVLFGYHIESQGGRPGISPVRWRTGVVGGLTPITGIMSIAAWAANSQLSQHDWGNFGEILALADDVDEKLELNRLSAPNLPAIRGWAEVASIGGKVLRPL
jgi:hypothetical protein